MKIGIAFSGNVPKITIYGLSGILLSLLGRIETIVSKDPTVDTLAVWFHFFIEQRDKGWQFDYRSNCKYTSKEKIEILQNILDKANRAIAQKKAADLSQEFHALNSMEPYSFGGLYSQMNELYGPVFSNRDPNQDIEDMREILKSSMTLNEIESDEHMKNFVLQNSLKIIRVDESSGKS